MGKIDFATSIPTSYRLIASISTFDYFKKEKLFSRNDKPAFNQKDERFVKLKVGLPFLSNKRAEFGVGAAKIQDRYFQKNVIVLIRINTIKALIVYSVVQSVLMEVR